MKKIKFIEYFRAIELELDLLIRYQNIIIDISSTTDLLTDFNKKKTRAENTARFAFVRNSFRKCKEKIKLLFLVCFESLELHLISQEFLMEFNGLKIIPEEDPKKAFDFGMNNLFPTQELVEKYLTVLKIQTEEQTIDKFKFRILESILKNSPKIISDAEINPKNEADVQRAIYKHLIYVFPDTLREVRIPKITKTFKPDFGIASLKCAIEYKFIASELEAKKFIGGIFEDSKGYSGSEDWNLFLAVIYMNDFYFTSQQIEEEFKLSEMEDNWKPIIVYGLGERKKK